MNRWGKATLVLLLGLAVGACTAAPKKVASTSPIASSSPTAGPTISVQPAAATTRTMSVLGTGTVEVLPDVIIASMVVSAQRGTLQAATNRVLGFATKIADAVTSQGGNSADVSTVATNISIIQVGRNLNYRVAQTIQVRVQNNNMFDTTKLLGRIAGVVGTNTDSGISTTYVAQEDDPFYAQARKAAMDDAKAAAASWASLSGVKLGRIQSVTEVAASPASSPSNLSGGYGYQTPSDGSITINKGAFTFTVRVNVVYAIK